MIAMEAENKYKLLIVDDEKPNLKLLTSILSPDYTIITALNGKNAVEKAKEYKPDLVLLDILMPGMDGYETFAELRKRKDIQKTPVIFLTDTDSGKNDDKNFSVDAADYIAKPFNASIVKLRVSNQIRLMSAAAASRGKAAFLAKLNHEIRTPLNAVLGISVIQLQKESCPPDIKDAFTKIFDSGDLLLATINDIMDISRFEAGRQGLAAAQYSTAGLINDVVNLNLIKYENKQLMFILIVDDVDINLYVAKEMLSPYGLDIDLAASGKEAIKFVKNNKYDMVFMDHIMPVMDGIDTIKEIRKLGYDKLPVIALTANAVSGVKDIFLNSGFNGFISKPIGLHELDMVLKQWMLPGKTPAEASSSACSVSFH